MAEVVVDTGEWPVVWVKLPDSVTDGAGERYVSDLQAVLDRGEPYAVIFEGRLENVTSPEFNSTYMRWYKQTFALQQKLCRGFVRVEADDDMRAAIIARADELKSKGAVPYPYEVVKSVEMAGNVARAMLEDADAD